MSPSARLSWAQPEAVGPLEAPLRTCSLTCVSVLPSIGGRVHATWIWGTGCVSGDAVIFPTPKTPEDPRGPRVSDLIAALDITPRPAFLSSLQCTPHLSPLHFEIQFCWATDCAWWRRYQGVRLTMSSVVGFIGIGNMGVRSTAMRAGPAHCTMGVLACSRATHCLCRPFPPFPQAAMARNLLKAGHRVVVCDRSTAAMAALESAGASSATTPAQLATIPGTSCRHRLASGKRRAPRVQPSPQGGGRGRAHRRFSGPAPRPAVQASAR